MPVPAKVGGVFRHHDQVVHPGKDGELTAGADVGLASRIRLYGDHDDVVHPSAADDGPDHRTDRESEGTDHEGDVERGPRLRAERVETHAEHGTGAERGHHAGRYARLMTWLQVEDRDAVRTITITRPERRNAIPPDGWGELTAVFEDFGTSPARVLVLRGAGGDFCAGADLGDQLTPYPVVEGKRRMKVTGGAALALHRLTKPTIAVVDGVAVGAGMNMAIGCDAVIATTRARFAEIFVRRGLTLDFGGSWLLPRVVGIQRAKDLALSGRIVDAGEAFALGLCLAVVEPGDLEARLAEQIERFLAGAPVAQMFAKQAIDHAWDVSFEDALDWEGQSQAICFTTADFVEGVRSFQNKRPPEFQGR